MKGGGGRIGKQRNGDRQCVGDKTRDLAEVLNVFGKWREKRKCCVSWKKRKQTVCVSGGGCRTEMRDRATSGGVDARTLTRLHVRDSTTKGGPADSN